MATQRGSPATLRFEKLKLYSQLTGMAIFSVGSETDSSSKARKNTQVMSRAPRRNNYVSLSEAYWNFAPRRLREKYWELEELPAPKRPDPSSTNWAESLQAFSAHVNHSWRTEPAVREMQENLIEKLRRGVLAARGLRTHPNMGEALEDIPSYYFDHAKIHWGINVLEKFGRRYEAVEIRRSETAGEDQIQQSAVPHTSAGNKRGRGRPSKREAINVTIAELVREGTDLRAYKPAAACELIRQRAQASGHDIRNGFSDPTVSNYLQRYILQKPTP